MEREVQSLPLASFEQTAQRDSTSVIELLQSMQNDYQHAKRQLEQVYRIFDEREALVEKQIRSAIDTVDSRSNLRRTTCLWIYCLGSFEVRCSSGKVEHWRSLKAKSLLKFMISQRRGTVPRDVLIETLWPNTDPDLANNNLKAAVYALRQALSPVFEDRNGVSLIITVDGNYMINQEVELWVDAEEFECHWSAARYLEKQGNKAGAVREYEAADRLYRGDHLEDDLYEEWTLLRREALKDTYLTILGKLGDYSMEASDYESAIIYCQKIITKDSCREDAYRRLMRSYSRLGQRNRAIQWYKLCDKTIRTELDLPPDHRTTALYNQLLNDEPI